MRVPAAVVFAFAAFPCVAVHAQTGTTPSSTTLTVAPNPVVLSSPVTLTAAVVPGAAAGKVTFYDGANILGSVALSGGSAQLTTKLLPGGLTSIVARYDGNATYATSVSKAVALTVTTVSSNAFRGPAIYATAANAVSMWSRTLTTTASRT